MRVAEALRRMPPSALLQLERHPSVRELVRPGRFTYEALYTTCEGVQALAERLSAPERRTMEAVVRGFASTPFDEAQLVKRAAPDMPGAELRIGLAGLRAAGIIVTARKAWGELQHALPDDALGAWQLALYGAPDAAAADAGVELTASAPGALDDDVFALLAYAAKNELALTQRGTLHKRHLHALQGELTLAASEPLQRMGPAYAFADTYDAGTAVVLDAALRLGLLAASGSALSVQPAPLRAWLRRPRAARDAVLRMAWTERLWPAEPLLQHAAAAAERAPRGVWLALPRLAAWLARFADAPAETLAELASVRWLEPLAALGWLELGRCARTGEPLLRIPPEAGDAPEQPGRFYVQPDFELIVPPDVPADVRWELERYAERRSSDQVHVYAVTRSSVRFACENGATADEMAGFLEEHAMFGLPDNVRQAIGQWAGAYGKVSFARVTLLRCADADLAEQVLRHPKVAAQVVARLSDTDFIVPDASVPDLRTLLDKAGLAPRLAIETPGAPAAAESGFPRMTESEASGEEAHLPDLTALAAASRGLLFGTDPLLVCELETELPEQADLLPDLKEVPAMWWKDYRAYHASTRKEMIRKAIEWQSLLKLRKDGQDRTVVPQRLLEDRSGWALVGIERGSEIRLSGYEWDEMKLLVPGINDK
jgi:hypothetical protein